MPPRQRFRTVVGQIVDGIDGGIFPAAPGERSWLHGTEANCAYCDFDALCPMDRAAQYDAKEDAPEMERLHDADARGGRMTAAVLVDDDVRRLITADGLDELLFVEAGAGTGKTTSWSPGVAALVLVEDVADARDRRDHLHRGRGGRAASRGSG